MACDGPLPVTDANGVTTCPPGYQYDPASGCCILLSAPIKVDVLGASVDEVDYHAQGKKFGMGVRDSGLPEHWGLANITSVLGLGVAHTADYKKLLDDYGGPIKNIIGVLFSAYLSGYDTLIAIIADFMGKGGTRDQPGFWVLIGSLISDLLGVNLDGTALYNQLQSHGTLPAMQEVGSGLINLLIGEFTGTAQGRGGEVSFSSHVNPVTNLPEAELTPGGGVNAAFALMGFVLTSAVRQANIEGIAHALPWGLGSQFEKYSEAMRSNLGIGRMMRFAFRPIFQKLVGDQIERAINLQYAPELLTIDQASNAAITGAFTAADLQQELALHGYNAKRQQALLNYTKKGPSLDQLDVLAAANQIDTPTETRWMRILGYDDDAIALIRKARELAPARKFSLAAAQHFLTEYITGVISAADLHTALVGTGALTGGHLFLLPAEAAAIESIASHLAAYPRKQLTFAQLKEAYLDGTISLVEFEDRLAHMGYNSDAVTTLGIDVLIRQKDLAAAAAKRAASNKSGSGPAAATTPVSTTQAP